MFITGLICNYVYIISLISLIDNVALYYRSLVRELFPDADITQGIVENPCE